jgi:hypothetical protein
MRKMLAAGFVLCLAGCSQRTPPDNSAAEPAKASATGQARRDDGMFTFDLTKYPAAIRPKLLAEAGERAACNTRFHAGPQTIAACDRLITIHRELEAKGWCRGPDAVQVANREWMRCGPQATPES